MQMFGTEHKEELEDGKLLLFTRDGIFQARVYKGDRKYIYRSLKTKKLDEARRLALRFYYEIEFRRAENLPLQQKTFNEVIDEYVALRQRQYDRSLLGSKNTSREQQTSIHMLRQIKRVVKFWREFCGKLAVDKIDNAKLQDFIAWRKDFYHNMAVEKRPKNARLNPADKTLEWELGLGNTLIIFAHERGYRGKNQLPTYRFRSAKKIVRPAFTLPEYRQLIQGMRKHIYEENNKERKYTRELLRDYVLILANSGMRVGEANNLKETDVVEFTDGYGRKNYMFNVKGKTGSRVVIPRTGAVRYVERVMERNELRKLEIKENIERKVRTPHRKKSDKSNWFFCMYDGDKLITLIDQFQALLEKLKLLENRYAERYTLYSLRHFYAVQMIKKGIPIFDIARNMGTSVQIIESYYGKSATPMELATTLGGDMNIKNIENKNKKSG
jgi:integrase